MDIENLFSPDKIGVVGASRQEGKTGHEIFDNLYHDFQGDVVPINPKADQIHGVKCFDEIPEDTDLVVVAVPAKIVPKVLKDAAEKKVQAAIVVSAGFSETGNKGLEEKITNICRENNISLLGPNVLGLINTENSMNASFASKMPSKGGISFMSQSGAFCTAILDYAKAEHIGFNNFVSLGNKSMLNEVDFLEYWQNDEDTQTILGYTEGIEDGREFLEAARETSKNKPIIMIKSGRSDEGGDAASSHTGSIAGSYEAYKAAFKQAGIVEAESNRELLDYGRCFAYQPLPLGRSIAIVTNAGGPGVVTTDEISERDMEVAKFSSKTHKQLSKVLPDQTDSHNPVDVIGDAGHERYKNALETVIKDENVDAVITILTPQANTEISKTAKTISKISKSSDKPVLASFMGEKEVEAGKEILERNKVPDFQDPMDAVKALKAMNDYREFLDRSRTIRKVEADEKTAQEAIENYNDFRDGKKLLESYGFNFPLTRLAETPAEAVESGAKVGYPVVLKLDSPDISHKTDIGAVKKGIKDQEEIKEGFHEIVDTVHREKPGAEINGVLVQEEMEGLEVALGLKRDPQFGPMVMVGLGGIYIEALDDLSFGIAPISEEDAQRMIHELRSHEVFENARGQNYSLKAVKDAIIRLGELGLQNEEVQSIDINPLILKKEKAYVADLQINLK